MKKRQKKQIIVNKTIEQPKPKEPTFFDKLKEVDFQDKFSATYNFLAKVFEEIMQAKTAFFLAAIGLAFIDVLLAGSSFTKTYLTIGYGTLLGEYTPYYIVVLFIAGEFLAVKAILMDFPYRASPIIPPTSSKDIKKVAEYEQKKIKREAKERIRKKLHSLRVGVIKTIALTALSFLIFFFVSFSYSKLTDATSSQMQNSESYMIQKQVIMDNIESLNRQIDQKYASIEAMPESYISKRQSEEEILKSLEEERRELNKELSDIVSGKKGIEETVSLQIRYAANALGIDVQEYIGMINLGVSIGLVSLYLIFFFLSQSLPSSKKLVTVKKIRRRKK